MSERARGASAITATRITREQWQSTAKARWLAHPEFKDHRLTAAIRCIPDIHTAEQFDSIVNNTSWTRIVCDSCRKQDCDRAVILQDNEYCITSTATWCESCVNIIQIAFRFGNSRADCDECAMEQDETVGRQGVCLFHRQPERVVTRRLHSDEVDFGAGRVVVRTVPDLNDVDLSFLDDEPSDVVDSVLTTESKDWSTRWSSVRLAETSDNARRS